MKANRWIAGILSCLMIISGILPLFSVSAYAKEDVKIRTLEEKLSEKEVLEATLDERLSTDKNLIIDVSAKNDLKDFIFVFQKGLAINENTILPEHIDVDDSYEDLGIYGEDFTSIRLINKAFLESAFPKILESDKNQENDLSSEKENMDLDISEPKENKKEAIEEEIAFEESGEEIFLADAKEGSLGEESISVDSHFKEQSDDLIKEELSLGEESISVDNDFKEQSDNPTREELSQPLLEESGQREEFSLDFDIVGDVKAGDFFAVISDKYSFVLTGDKGYKTDKEKTDILSDKEKAENDKSDKPEEKAVEDKVEPRAYWYGYGRYETGAVRFIVQNSWGKPLGLVRFQLNAVKDGKEEWVKSASSGLNGELNFYSLAWNVPYKLYVTILGFGYQKPQESVADFYFDENGIHFTKGGSGIVLLKNGEKERPPLSDHEYYGFIGTTGRLKLSKEFSQTSGIDAFCFRAEDTFPSFGKDAVYYELEMTPEALWAQAQKPRAATPKELYDAVRKVIYYCESHKDYLLKDYGLGSSDFWIEGRDKELGYYKALQESLWYYSNSIENLKEYSPNHKIFPLMQRAVWHIIEESKKVSEEDMNSVHIKLYKSDRVEKGKPLQSLLVFELDKVKRTEIKIRKLAEDGASLKGAIFTLEKLNDASFSPKVLGQDSELSEFLFMGLSAGEYRLIETKAPKGYKKIVEPIEFSVHETTQGFLIELKTNNDKISLVDHQLTIEVRNEAEKFLLPETGGEGSYLFTLMGMACIAIFLMLMGLRNKKIL